MGFLAIILLLIYVIFFGIWLFFFHKSLIEKKESKEKICIIYVSFFLLFTYTVSFIVLEIPN